MNYAVVLQNGEMIEIEEAEIHHDPIENAVVFKFENGTYSKFYWPNIAYYVAVSGML